MRIQGFTSGTSRCGWTGAPRFKYAVPGIATSDETGQGRRLEFVDERGCNEGIGDDEKRLREMLHGWHVFVRGCRTAGDGSS